VNPNAAMHIAPLGFGCASPPTYAGQLAQHAPILAS